MKLQKTTQHFYPPVRETTKRRYLERLAEEQEADKEIKEYEPEASNIPIPDRVGDRQSAM